MRLSLGMVLALLAAPLPAGSVPAALSPFLGAGAALAQRQAPAPPSAQQRPAERAQEREVVVANELGIGLREIYVFPSGSLEPGQDRLGLDTLPSGATLRIPLGRQRLCLFDLRGVLTDGSTEERRGVDLCRNSRVTFGDPSAPLREARVTNDTDLAMRELYAMPSGAGMRGPDRLGAELVAPEQDFRLRLGRARECLYDLTAVFEDDSVEERARVDLCRRNHVTFGDPSIPWREAEVENGSARSIRNLYVARPAAQPVPEREGPERERPERERPERWGPDRLGADLLEPGESFRLRLRSRACQVELRAVYDDEAAEEKSADLCETRRLVFDGSGIPRAPERAVTVVNRHGATVQEVYASPINDTDWGEDRLNGAPLERNNRAEVVLRSGCEIDLRIVFGNGGAEERRGLNICETGLIVLRPGWTLSERLDQGAGPIEPGPPREGSVRLRNTAAVPLVELYVDPPGAARGNDRLGATVLGRGEMLDFTPPEGLGCTAHLRGVFRDGRQIDRPGFDLCSGTEVTLP